MKKYERKKEALKNISDKKYALAGVNLEKYFEAIRDPEALIFLNNANIENERTNNPQKIYTIAISVPIDADPNASLEMLRGVAQAQDEIYKDKENKFRLKVVIANDKEDEETAKKVALKLVKNKKILGLIGHSTSDITLAVGDIYEKKSLHLSPPLILLWHFQRRNGNTSFARSPTIELLLRN